MSDSPNPHYTPSVTPMPLRIPQANSWLSDERLVCIIIVASVCYQGVLCLINSTIMPLNRTLLGATEALLLMMCIPLLLRRLLPGVILLGVIAMISLLTIWLINQQINIKSVRDLIMPLCFFWLGCNIGRPEIADRAFKLAIGVVLIMGLFEAVALDYYTRWFNIFNYYVNMGVMTPGADSFIRDDKLMSNGMRPEDIGRTLLPQLLGPHRVSSVFLEPIAAGNFATISAAWGLSRPASQWREGAFFVVAALILMVLCDSRFALMSVSLLFAVRVILSGKLLYLCMLAPLGAIALLLVVGYTTPNETGGIMSDDFHGRLAYSGWSLMKFDAPMLFGIGHSKTYFDEGYAQLMASFGLPLVLLLWFSIWLLPVKNDTALRFRAMASIYIALILCISGTSLFALKTSGILWFLIGCSLLSPVVTPAVNCRLKSSPVFSSSPPAKRSMSHAD